MKTSKYEAIMKAHEKKPPYLKNIGLAFFFGGLVAVFGQTLIWTFTNVLGFPEDQANTYMVVTVILMASLATGLGFYDKFGQIAKAGAFVPISGFANSLTSAALEGRSEGIVLGIAAGLFKLAGAVIVFAVVSGFFFGLLRYFLDLIGIMTGVY